MKISRGEQGVKNITVQSRDRAVMRCPGCQQLATLTKNAAGQPVYRCNCGREFRAQALR